jgi:hypothetical protein
MISDPDAPTIHLKAGEKLGYFSVVEDDFIKEIMGPMKQSPQIDGTEFDRGNEQESQFAQQAASSNQLQSGRAQNPDLQQATPENSSNEQASAVWNLEFQPDVQEHFSNANEAEKKKSIKTWLSHLNTSSNKNDICFIPPDPLEVLNHMLQTVEILHSDRYGEYLQQHRDEITEDLKSLLRPQAWDVLNSKTYTREK